MTPRWSFVLCLLVAACASVRPEKARVQAPTPAPAVATSTESTAPAAPSPAPTPAPAPTPPAPAAAPATSATAPNCVVIQATTEPAGLREEGKWLREHFPGWKKTGQSLGIGEGDQRFDSIDIVSPTGEKRTVCFDITKFFGKF